MELLSEVSLLVLLVKPGGGAMAPPLDDSVKYTNVPLILRLVGYIHSEMLKCGRQNTQSYM